MCLNTYSNWSFLTSNPYKNNVHFKMVESIVISNHNFSAGNFCYELNVVKIAIQHVKSYDFTCLSSSSIPLPCRIVICWDRSRIACKNVEALKSWSPPNLRSTKSWLMGHVIRETQPRSRKKKKKKTKPPPFFNSLFHAGSESVGPSLSLNAKCGEPRPKLQLSMSCLTSCATSLELCDRAGATWRLPERHDGDRTCAT